MIGRNRHQHPSARELAALADGSLTGSRRSRVERAVAASPELQADITAQRRALQAVETAAAERAPSALKARLELARDPRQRRGVRRPAWASASVAVAAAASAAVLALAGSPASAPTVASAATLATRSPALPVGAADEGRLVWPWAAGAGLSFPNWARPFGFTAVGARIDRLSGRVATTVFYAVPHSGNLIGYTIVSGRELAAGTPVRQTSWDGEMLSTFSEHGRAVVTWIREGHTCVLSGSPTLLKQLMRLAASTPRYSS